MAHTHHHAHGTTDNLRGAFFLNLAFALIELVGGLLTNSVAVLSDAVHDLGDSISLGLAWGLQRYAGKESDTRFSYGYQRFALLGALLNAVILVTGSAFVVREAVGRLQAPEAFSSPGLIALALLGVGVNGAAMLRLRGDGGLNARVMALHLLEDVLGWIAVLVVGIVSLFVYAPILDPLLALGIAAFVLFNAARRLLEIGRVFLQAVPAGVDVGALGTRLAAIDGVRAVHDVRVWSLDGDHHVLTAHLVVDPHASGGELQRIKGQSREAVADMHLEDVAIQFDLGEADCTSEGHPEPTS